MGTKTGIFINCASHTIKFDLLLTNSISIFCGKREQQVDIYLNYIGHFTPPINADPDEETAEIEAEEKRAVWREYKRNQRAKTKQETSDNQDTAQEIQRKAGAV